MTNQQEERFGDALDAIVTGRQARDPDPLVTFALALQGAEGAPNAEPLDAARRAAIWRTLMAGNHHPPTTGGPGPLAQPAMALPANPWRRRIEPRSRRNGFLPVAAHVQPFVTAVALVALLLAAWGSFVSMRETGTPSVTPTAFAHGAAIASPEASPAAEQDWMAPVQATECDVEPMSFEAYAEIMRREPDVSARSYGVQGPVAPEIVAEVVRTARVHDACTQAGAIEQQRALETPAYIFLRTANANRTTSDDELNMLKLEHVQELSAQLPTLAPEQLLVVADEAPENILKQIEASPASPMARYWYGYNPALAVMLDDGRVALPLVNMSWAKDPHSLSPEDTASEPAIVSSVVIFSNASGEWKLDEWLFDFCSGDCNAFWNRLESPATPVVTPIATPID